MMKPPPLPARFTPESREKGRLKQVSVYRDLRMKAERLVLLRIFDGLDEAGRREILKEAMRVRKACQARTASEREDT